MKTLEFLDSDKSKRIFLILLFMAICSLMIHSAMNFDIWFHLTGGKYIWQNLSIPDKDFISFSAAGQDWTPVSWLAEVIFYGFYKYFGDVGVKIPVVIIGFFTFFILFRTYRLFGGNFYISCLALAFAGLQAKMFWQERPQVFSYFFIALIGYILALYKYKHSSPESRSYPCGHRPVPGPRSFLFFLPIIFLFWANMHPSFFLGLGLVGIFIISEMIEQRTADSGQRTGKKIFNFKKILYPLGFIFILCVLAVFINPSPLKVLAYPFKIIFGFAGKHIAEWRRFHEYLFMSPFSLRLWSIFIFVLITWGLALWYRKNLNFYEWMSLFIITALLFGAARNQILFHIIASPVFVKCLSGLIRKSGIKFSIIPGKTLILALILAPFFIFSHLHAGYGWDKKLFPVKAVEFLEKTNLSGNLYQPLPWGGYIMWKLYPRFRVFIDGRIDMYEGTGVFEFYEKKGKTLAYIEDTADKFGFKIVLDIALPWDRDVMRRLLSQSDKWKLIYWDETAFIFVKDVPEHNETIKKYECRYSNPYKPEKCKYGKVEDVIKEYDRVLSYSESNYVALNNLGMFYYSIGSYQEALLAYQAALEIKPDYKCAWQNLKVTVEKIKMENGNKAKIKTAD